MQKPFCWGGCHLAHPEIGNSSQFLFLKFFKLIIKKKSFGQAAQSVGPWFPSQSAASAVGSLGLWASREVVPVPIFRNAALCLGLMWTNPPTAHSQGIWKEAS